MSDEQTKPKIGIAEPDIHDDPFDLKKLRISQNFLEATPVKKLTTTVPVHRPGPQDFFRVHPAPNYRELMAFLELKDDRETYVVDLNAVPDLQSECFIATLLTAIIRTGVLFMWVVRVPAADGRTNNWHLSAAAAEAARAEAATARAELEQARTEMQAAVERTERAEARERSRGAGGGNVVNSDPIHRSVSRDRSQRTTGRRN